MEDVNPTQQLSDSELRKIDKEFNKDVAIIKGRPILQKLFFVVWAAFDVALVTLFLFVVVGYLIAGQFSDRKEVSSMADNISSLRSFAINSSASSLLFGDVTTISLGDGKYDFVTTVTNSNSDWYAEFDYYFQAGSETTDRAHGFVMPLQITPIASLNQEFSSISGSEIVIEDLTWRRINAHEISDIEVWLNDHDNFTIEGAEYSRDVKLENTSIPRSSFTITNNSSYSYWSAVFYVLLERNGTVVGVNQISIPGFEVGETRDVDVSWFGEVVTSAEVGVYPYINYFDDDEFMSQPSKAAEIDLRDIER